MIGILPQELYDMELWEFNACVNAYNKKYTTESKEKIALCWQTANFVGAAFGGKLKRLSHYINDDNTKIAPQVSKEEFEEKLKLAEERGKSGVA